MSNDTTITNNTTMEVYTHTLNRNMKFIRLMDFQVIDSGMISYHTAVLKCCQKGTWVNCHDVYLSHIATDVANMYQESTGTRVDMESFIELLKHVIRTKDTLYIRCNISFTKQLQQCAVECLDIVLSNMDRCHMSVCEAAQHLKRHILSIPNEPLWRSMDRLESFLQHEAMHRFYNKRAATIQRIWRDVISNPYHDICKRRLMREFQSMVCV